jgi:hypothetical protein
VGDFRIGRGGLELAGLDGRAGGHRRAEDGKAGGYHPDADQAYGSPSAAAGEAQDTAGTHG